MNKKLSVFSLTLITVGSVDSIRNLPAAAIAGSQLFNYFTLALVFFLIPCAIIAIWFSKQSSQGIYGWVKAGLGQRWAFLAIWFQCLQNVLIYPTLLSFIAGSLLFSMAPTMANNKILIFLIILSLIWGLTWVNLKGIQSSSRFNTFCTITGLVIPFTIILIMGLYWGLTQMPDQSILPPAAPYSWTSLTAIILSFCGIELAAVHSADSQKQAFGKAITISVCIIFLSMLAGAITLAMIIPNDQLNFISGIPQLIQLFFTKIQYAPLAIIINILISIGCIGAANNWLIAPIKGLGFAAEEGFLNKKFTKLNKNSVPARLLVIQALCVTIISSLFLVIPSLNASYWLMLNTATQVYLLMYLLMFISAIIILLAKEHPSKIKLLTAASFGLAGVTISLIVSLAPPPSLELSTQCSYALLGALFLIAMSLMPFIGKRLLTK